MQTWKARAAAKIMAGVSFNGAYHSTKTPAGQTYQQFVAEVLNFIEDKIREHGKVIHTDREVALVWGIDDVQSEEVRPDLTDAQALEVLQTAEANHDANYGIGWDSLRDTANELFPQTKGGGHRMRIFWGNWRGGVNNLCVCIDDDGIKGTSTKSEKQAKANCRRNKKNKKRIK